MEIIFYSQNEDGNEFRMTMADNSKFVDPAFFTDVCLSNINLSIWGVLAELCGLELSDILAIISAKLSREIYVY